MSRQRLSTLADPQRLTRIRQPGGRSLWFCDAEADLPVLADGADTGDWAFAATEATLWKRTAAETWSQFTAGSGAPTGASYLTTVAEAGLSAEVVVGRRD